MNNKLFDYHSNKLLKGESCVGIVLNKDWPSFGILNNIKSDPVFGFCEDWVVVSILNQRLF